VRYTKRSIGPWHTTRLHLQSGAGTLHTVHPDVCLICMTTQDCITPHNNTNSAAPCIAAWWSRAFHRGHDLFKTRQGRS
jgi:hypothetical protein